MVVEHVFGVLKDIFRRLEYVETKSIEKATRMVCAACVLHNMCSDQNDDWEREADDVENNCADGGDGEDGVPGERERGGCCGAKTLQSRAPAVGTAGQTVKI